MTTSATDEFLVRAGRFLTTGEVSADLRTVTKQGGREGDVFYRDRWSHDKVVRSTHGVNCTGSCSWKVYVKDGIITWETQQTDYPSVGPDSPEYEPRGCPRGAAFSWYTYSPTRVRYPYVRGVLLEAYRAAKAANGGDPVKAWAAVVNDPETRRRYQQARGKGGLVRASWAEAIEMIAAAHVHTIDAHGPDRVFGFSPIPAMSMAIARRRRPLREPARRRDAVVLRLVRRPAGGLPAGVRRPDRRAGVRRLVERLLPDHVGLERPADPHPGRALHGRGALPRPEGRHGQPGLRRQHEVRRRVDGPHPGTDGALAMAMGHVILKEFFIERQVPRFVDYVKKFTDLPFLVTLRERDGAYVPDKFVTAADLGDTSENAAFKTVLVDSATGRPHVPNGSMGFRYGDEGEGKWNLDLEGDRPGAEPATARPARRPPRCCCRASTSARRAARAAGSTTAACPRPSWRPAAGPRLVTTVFDLMLAQYGVGREGLPGRVADRLRRPGALHPGLAGGDHRRAGRDGRADRPGVRAERRGVRRPVDDHPRGRAPTTGSTPTRSTARSSR